MEKVIKLRKWRIHKWRLNVIQFRSVLNVVGNEFVWFYKDFFTIHRVITSCRNFLIKQKFLNLDKNISHKKSWFGSINLSEVESKKSIKPNLKSDKHHYEIRPNELVLKPVLISHKFLIKNFAVINRYEIFSSLVKSPLVIYSIKNHPFHNLLLMGNYAVKNFTFVRVRENVKIGENC